MLFDTIHALLVKKGPLVLRAPLKIIPYSLKKQFIEQMLYWQFRQALMEEELDFMVGRWVKIEIRDIGLIWSMTLDKGQFKISEPTNEEEVTFSGELNDLILIANHHIDPDTLFFQRRLLIEGDTELGLYIKNLIDHVDPKMMPIVIQIAFTQLAKFISSSLKQDDIHQITLHNH